MIDMKGTKLRIFETAADLFAYEGYHAVSVRQIADIVGLKAASLYNHFESKEKILLTIYQYFDENMELLAPDLDHLLDLVETKHPYDIMRKLTIVFPPDIISLMSKTMLVTASMAHSDPKAEHLIYKNLIDMTERYDRPLLKKMIRFNKIEPLDINAFVIIHSNYHYSSAVRFCAQKDKAIATEDWLNGLELMYQLIKIKKN